MRSAVKTHLAQRQPASTDLNLAAYEMKLWTI